jgi:molecular chaperone DnaK
MGRMIGIDFGEKNCVVAVVELFKDSIKILHNKEGEYETRSVVGYWKGEFKVGSPALRILSMDPQNIIISVKRLMGRSISDSEVDRIKKSALYRIVEPTDGTKDSVCVVLGGKEYYPEDVSAMILKKLKADAEYVLGEEVTHAVITVPAYFSEKQRHATREAGLKAGLNVMNILDEPTAAAIAFGIGKGTDKTAKAIVVYDLGGGTFDVSVLMMAGGSFAPLDLEGDMWLGGDNFDQAIIDYATEIIKKEHGVDPTNNIKFMSELKIEAQKAKETLSSANRAFIMGIFNDNSERQIPYEIEVTKEQFEKMIEPLVDRTIDLVKLALENSRLTSEDIDHILMVGDASSVSLVHKKVEGLFGKEKMLRNIHPKHCVARGAAIIAATYIGEEIRFPFSGTKTTLGKSSNFCSEPFELTTHLGTGCFGQTWLVRVIDPDLREEWGEEVAIKIPYDKYKEKALKKEIRLNGSLQLQLTLEESRNIVEYLDFETYKGKTVMVMKYVKGGNLRNKMGTIRYRKKMSLEEAIIVAKGVLNGLSVIHKKKILHRDIKPENILIDENIPKIADFGVGRMLKTGEFASTVTGTIFYMPPESLLCPKEKEDALVKGASFNSDIWSFGIMFYEMLCGKYPFGITEQIPLSELIKRITNPEIKLEFPANIPIALQNIISKSLERDPKFRYQTADDMLRDIEHFLLFFVPPVN